MKIFLMIVFAVSLIACGDDEYNGECIYNNSIHTQFNTEACAEEAAAQSCGFSEVEDRSTAEDTVLVCVYSECPLDQDTPDFDCEKFRSL